MSDCNYCRAAFTHEEYEEYIDYLMDYVHDIELGEIPYNKDVLSFAQFIQRTALEEHYY